MILPSTKIPEISLQIVEKNEFKQISSKELFNKKTVLFGLPGAFTPICSKTQLPGFANQEQALREKGYEQIVCMSVNDAFVMQAWKQQAAPNADIIMLADGNAAFAKALGVVLDLSEKHMGVRCTRFLAVIENGSVTKIDAEDNPGVCSVSAAESLL